MLVPLLVWWCAVALAAAPRAGAHAVLQDSNPRRPTRHPVRVADARVSLRFDESVEVRLGAVEVVSGAGQRVDLGVVTHPGGNATAVEVALRTPLAEGSYLVLWRVVSADSHPVSGWLDLLIRSARGGGRGDAVR